MAGHSKWKNIQHRKNKQDAERGKSFTKLIREITTAARLGGEDHLSNPRLRSAIDKALSQNMTRDTIDKAIQRGLGRQAMEAAEILQYEGYGPGGIAILMECITDNRNRTISEIRTVFKKYDANLGSTGSVAHLFTEQGRLFYEIHPIPEQLIEIAVQAGASDFIEDENGIEIISSAQRFGYIKDALAKNSFHAIHGEVGQVALTPVKIEDHEINKIISKFLEALENLEDVQTVYTNLKD